MLDIRDVAVAFPPGEFIKEELEARGWTQEVLAEITGITAPVISNIIKAKRAISVDIASSLAAAFGTTAQFWMNLETSYQLWTETRTDSKVARKGRLYAATPINELVKRGWIEMAKDISLLEERVLRFLDKNSLDEPSQLVYATRKATEKANSSQVAWVHRAQVLARSMKAPRFTDGSFAKALKRLKEIRKNPEDIREIAKILADGGVRLILIEGLPKGKIDGAAFWLDEYSPGVVLSMRYDRLDHFWFVLMHELGHITNRDALGGLPVLDVNLVGEDAISFEEKSDIEKRADEFAESFLVEKREIETFIRRFRPLYSKQKIRNFSARIGVHPAIVLGQLQHRKEVDWSHSREMLVKVRQIVISGTLTDGWGNVPPAM